MLVASRVRGERVVAPPAVCRVWGVFSARFGRLGVGMVPGLETGVGVKCWGLYLDKTMSRFGTAQGPSAAGFVRGLVGGGWWRVGGRLGVVVGVTVGVTVFCGGAMGAVINRFLAPPISEVPTEEHGKKVAVAGPLNGVNAMAVSAGRLFVEEVNEIEGGFRLDEFESGGLREFLSQIHTEAGTAGDVNALGVAVGEVAGEPEVFAAKSEVLGGKKQLVVAVYGMSGVLKASWTGAGTPNRTFTCETEAHGLCSLLTGVAVDDSSRVEDWAAGDVYVATLSKERPEFDAINVMRPGAGDVEPGEVAALLPGTERKPESEPGVITPFVGPRGVAVDALQSDVLVADDDEVDVLEPSALEGVYKFLFAIVGTPAGSFQEVGGSEGVKGVAVNSGDGEVEVWGNEYGAQVVDEFNPTGKFEGRLRGTPAYGETPASPFHAINSVAVDPASGDVFVGDRGAQGSGSGVVDLFGRSLVVPDVALVEPVSDLGVSSVTVGGTVDPVEAGAATCEFEYGTTAAFGQVVECSGVGSRATPVANGSSAVGVRASLGGLVAGATYFYRLVASNANGASVGEQTGQFRTLGPTFVSESAGEVSSTSATLQATVDPNRAATSVYFQYSTSDTEGCTSVTCFVIPGEAGEAIGAGESEIAVPGQVAQNLLAGKEYHFRAVAVSDITVETAPGSGVFEEQTQTFYGPDRMFVTQGAGSFNLPDGREWELVSPPDKRGAQIEPISAQWTIQAAADGDAMAWVTDAPTEPEDVSGYVARIQVLSTRTSSGWQSKDLATPHDIAPGLTAGLSDEVEYFSDDLSHAAVQPFGAFSACESAQGAKQPCLSPEATEQTALLRTDYYGGNVEDVCASSCFTPFVSKANDTAEPFQPFGEEGECPLSKTSGEKGVCGPEFLGATADMAHVLLGSNQTPVALTGTAIPEGGLYEWSAGVAPKEQLELVSLLPENEAHEELPARDPLVATDVRNAISSDGSRVFWSNAFGERHLYLRDLARRKTLQLDVPGAGCVREVKCGQGVPFARFQVASVDGARVFFTDPLALTRGAGHGGTFEADGDLYECVVTEGVGGPECDLTDVTPVTGGEQAEVLGDVTGASGDGSWVYFVAHGRLAAGAIAGGPNLYVRHGGVTRLVAVLSSEDVGDWAGSDKNNLDTLTARVSGNGRWLAFMSSQSLTGYDNTDASNSAVADEEVYLYHAPEDLAGEAGTLACASCDPTGGRPVGREYGSPIENEFDLFSGFGVWGEHTWIAGNVPGFTPYEEGRALYQSRFLSDEGRLFFDSSDGLVPRDVNGGEDVYEYEPVGVPVGGADACSSSGGGGSVVFKPARVFEVEGGRGEEGAGCVGLISSGASAQESAFLDASESGGDVFFLTSARLVAADVDESRDVYDAHECTGVSPCLPVGVAAPSACNTEASCKASSPVQPQVFGAPATATFSGQGNPVFPAPAAAVKPLTRAEKLAKALGVCRRDKKRPKRVACERVARKRYGVVKKASVPRRRGK